jgi:hypothetical protein
MNGLILAHCSSVGSLYRTLMDSHSLNVLYKIYKKYKTLYHPRFHAGKGFETISRRRPANTLHNGPN